MTLRNKKNTSIHARSQVNPGFAAKTLKAFTAGFAFLALLASFASFDYLNDTVVFEVSRAEASAGMAAGIAPTFTQNQKRSFQRAVSANHDNIYELQGASIEAAFGAPELVRADLPTIIWQYRSASCVLDVYFKSKDDQAAFAPVVHYEIRARNGELDDSPNAARCLSSLMPSIAAPRMLDVSAFYKSYM